MICKCNMNRLNWLIPSVESRCNRAGGRGWGSVSKSNLYKGALTGTKHSTLWESSLYKGALTGTKHSTLWESSLYKGASTGTKHSTLWESSLYKGALTGTKHSTLWESSLYKGALTGTKHSTLWESSWEWILVVATTLTDPQDTVRRPTRMNFRSYLLDITG